MTLNCDLIIDYRIKKQLRNERKTISYTLAHTYYRRTRIYEIQGSSLNDIVSLTLVNVRGAFMKTSSSVMELIYPSEHVTLVELFVVQFREKFSHNLVYFLYQQLLHKKINVMAVFLPLDIRP